MVVFAIHGPSCSGKTTVCNNLKDKINAKVLCQDDFYQYAPEKLHKVVVKGVEELDFDCKDSISQAEFKEKMIELKEENDLTEEDEVLLVEGTMLTSFDWLHDFVDVWILLATDKDDCTERRKKRVYTYPESPDYYPHHAYPASENMKWDFVQNKANDQTAYICQMHGNINECCNRMVDIVNSHVKTPIETDDIHIVSKSDQKEEASESQEQDDIATITTKAKTATITGKKTNKETTITTITEQTKCGSQQHTLETTIINSPEDDNTNVEKENENL
eukprot:m.22612 g.22612  ORF g.22612 m.22612 type:complete len:276 (+) comp8867_c0_seq1:42-869(+)